MRRDFPISIRFWPPKEIPRWKSGNRAMFSQGGRRLDDASSRRRRVATRSRKQPPQEGGDPIAWATAARGAKAGDSP